MNIKTLNLEHGEKVTQDKFEGWQNHWFVMHYFTYVPICTLILIMWKSTENVKFYPPEVVSQNEEGAVKSHLCA